MSVSQEEMTYVKKNKGLHSKILTLYIKEGKTLEEIRDILDFGHSKEVSAITRAYGFSGGSERGKYKGIDDWYIEQYLSEYSPGFEHGEQEVTFKEFLKSNQQPLPKYTASINTTVVQNNEPIIPSRNQARSINSNRQQAYDEDAGIEILKLAVPIIIIFCIYKVIVGGIIPAIGEGLFRSKLVFQKQSEMQVGDLKKGSYFGEMKWNKPNGYGSLILNDSNVYIGEFKRGKMHNRGVLLSDNHTVQYMGEFNSDQYDGFGMLKEQDGTTYIGGFSKGKKHGLGVIENIESDTWTIGKYYKGTCKETYATINSITREVVIEDTKNYKKTNLPNGILVGEGKNIIDGFCIGISDDYLSVGYYHNGKPDGTFIKLLNIGDIEYGNSHKEDILDAIIYQINQGIVVGNYKKGYIDGYGMEYMEDGDIFIGNYKDGQRHGKGTYIFSNKESRKVVYKKGILVEE